MAWLCSHEYGSFNSLFHFALGTTMLQAKWYYSALQKIWYLIWQQPFYLSTHMVCLRKLWHVGDIAQLAQARQLSVLKTKYPSHICTWVSRATFLEHLRSLELMQNFFHCQYIRCLHTPQLPSHFRRSFSVSLLLVCLRIFDFMSTARRLRAPSFNIHYTNMIYSVR